MAAANMIEGMREACKAFTDSVVAVKQAGNELVRETGWDQERESLRDRYEMGSWLMHGRY